LGFGLAPSRFSDPEVTLAPPDRFGVVYLGSNVKVCFAEAILRDRGIGHAACFPIELDELTQWTCAEIVVDRKLRLADLRNDNMLRMRMPTDTVRAKSHVLGQAWSRAIWLHNDTPDGIIYDSRLNIETNVAIYDRALPKLTAKASGPLMSRRDEMAAIMTEFDLAIIP